MKAVITVIGKDQVGIIAAVSAKCADFGANILENTQSVLDKYFAMIMIADIDALRLRTRSPRSDVKKGWRSAACTRTSLPRCTRSERKDTSR